MPNITYSVLLGLAGMIPMGLANAMAKTPTQKIGPIRLIFFRNIFTILFLLPFLLWNINQTSFDTRYILFSLVLSIVVYIAMIFFYKGLSIGKVGLVSPVASSYVILSLTFSALLLNSTITKFQALSIVVIIAGIILSSFNPADLRKLSFFDKKSGLPYALITMVLWGVFFFLAQIPNKVLGPYLNSILFEIGMFCCAFLQLRNNDKIKPLEAKLWPSTITISALTVISVIAFYVGLDTGNPAIILVLNSATPLVIVLYGLFVYKEKLTGLQYLAISLILVGILFISFLK